MAGSILLSLANLRRKLCKKMLTYSYMLRFFYKVFDEPWRKAELLLHFISPVNTYFVGSRDCSRHFMKNANLKISRLREQLLSFYTASGVRLKPSSTNTFPSGIE